MHDLDRSAEYVVIGSGPTAVACLSLLIEKGIRPVVLDFGLESIKNSGVIDRTQKVWFNSSAPYQQPSTLEPIYHKDIKVRPSYGLGGFSRVWGATCNLSEDFLNWDASIRPNKSDIELVSGLLNPSTYEITRESCGEQVYKTVQKLGSDLIALNPTLAIDTRSTSKNKCINLGNCQTGCDADSIWYAGDLVKKWIESDLIDYRSGVLVEKLVARDNIVDIYSRIESQIHIFRASKVFLGTGVLSTSQILLNSKILEEIVLKETPTYFLAAFSFHSGALSIGNNLTLSKAWITNQTKNFLLQIYSPGKGNLKRIQGALPALFSRGPILRVATKFLMPLIIYAEEVPAAKMFINPEKGRIEITPIKIKERSIEFKRIVKLIRKQFAKSLSLIPPHQFFLKKEVLAGYHFGASIPHGKVTDELGQISGFDNIYVIDASVLPQISPGSIASIAMINAARITRRVITNH